MTTGKKILIALGIILTGAAIAVANLWFARDAALRVTTEAVRSRDLEAIVSASGKIQPKRLVQIAAETAGRVVDLAVNEGDRVSKGQFLLQIDPRLLRTRVDSGTASLSAAEAALEQQRQSIQTARVQVDQAQKNLARQQEHGASAAAPVPAVQRVGAARNVEAHDRPLSGAVHRTQRLQLVNGQPDRCVRQRQRPSSRACR